jgi:transposase
MSESLPIPDTLEACQQELREVRQAYAQLERKHQELLDTCVSIQDAQQKLREENEEQQLTIQQLLHQLYGRRSERHKDARGQQHLDFGVDETAALAVDGVGLTLDEEIVVQYTRRRKQRAEQPRSEALPEHLPRRTERIEPPLPEGVKPEDCQPIGIDIVEILRFKRPELWVHRLEYPKYKVPEVSASPILQAPREVALIEGGRFGIDLATEIVFSKFVLHVPLYRQQDALAQLGWSPSRSTLCQIVATAGDLIVPLVEQLRLRVLASGVIASDDTPVTLLTPGVGKGSRQARFWIYRGIHEAPYNIFAFTDSRVREGPDRFLESFRGILLGDCYSGYVNIEQVTGGRIEFSACLAHARRKVFLSREQCPALSSPLLALLGELYDIEDRGRLLSDAQRLVLRQQESVPVTGRVGVSVRRVGATGAGDGGPELAAAGRLESRPSRSGAHVPRRREATACREATLPACPSPPGAARSWLTGVGGRLSAPAACRRRGAEKNLFAVWATRREPHGRPGPRQIVRTHPSLDAGHGRFPELTHDPSPRPYLQATCETELPAVAEVGGWTTPRPWPLTTPQAI